MMDGEGENVNPWVTELRSTAAANNNTADTNNRPNSNNTAAMAGNGGATSSFTQIGNDRDFASGFMSGFFVGFFMLVWVWMPTVRHKQKLGILTGITVQLALNMLRPPQTDDDLDLQDDIPNAYYYKLGQPEMDDSIVLG